MPFTFSASALMPDGKVAGSEVSLPSESRTLDIQQSSIFTYSYPHSASPVFTIASAICTISSSFILFLKAFQLAQPMGGVSAVPFANLSIPSVCILREAASFFTAQTGQRCIFLSSFFILNILFPPAVLYNTFFKR